MDRSAIRNLDMTVGDIGNRLVVLGFDGMDYDMTCSFIERGLLPNIAAMARNGRFAPFPSVFPPDSIPSWITAFCGLDPSEHGVLGHVNYLLPGNKEPVVDMSIFHGNTFWDRIGVETKTEVCIVNPFLAYPVWPVNGVMVSGPVFVKGDIEASDPAKLAGLKIPSSLGGIDELPTRKSMVDFLQRTLNDTREQAEFGLRLIKTRQPGLFFQTYYTPDRVQHHLWRYCDPSDPTYPGPNEVEEGLTKFFAAIDGIVGTFLNELKPGDQLMIISDHGHGMRCTHCFNINEYLCRQGYLESMAKNRFFNARIAVERIKNRVLRFMNDHDLEDYISEVAKLIPNAHAMKKGAHVASYSTSKAYASDFAGTNPFGGIVINRDMVDDYEAFRAQLMDELASLEHDKTKLFRWIKPREAIYHGRHIDRYPDILYEMAPHIGTGFSMHCNLVTTNPTHKKISGGHRANGVFILSETEGLVVDTDKCKIANMYATLLARFGLNAENGRGENFLIANTGALAAEVAQHGTN